MKRVINKVIYFLRVIRANPAEYVQRYGSVLKQARELPSFVTDIKTPDGLVLAANYQYNNLYELEGDLQALRLVDLDREGLGEYRTYLNRLGVSGGAGAAAVSSVGFGGNYGASSSVSYGNAASYGSASASVSSDLVEQVFRSLNADNDNRISRSEAERAFLQLNSRLGRSYGENEVSSFFAALDKNGDGYLDLSEFRRAFLNL